MYNEHFGFSVKPFQINADPRFLWLGEKHKEALSVLKYGVLENRGFLLLTGDVGTGKTTLLNALLEDLDPSVLVARIPDPKLDLLDFINILAGALDMKESFQSRGPFLVSFEEFLQRQHYSGRNVLLIIDEAQRLTYDLLEEIRAFSNLEKPHAKFLNVFFAGQDEFNDMLLDYRSRAIRQRITLSYHIEPLNREETGEYVRHRQKVAGGKNELFSRKAVDLIHEFSEGFPRLINIICDHALLTAYVRDKRSVSDTIVSECARNLELRSYSSRRGRPVAASSAEPLKEAAEKRESRKPGKRRRTAVLLVLLFLLAVGCAAYLWMPVPSEWHEFLPVRQVTGGQTEQSAETGIEPPLVSEESPEFEAETSPGSAGSGSEDKAQGPNPVRVDSKPKPKIRQKVEAAKPRVRQETLESPADVESASGAPSAEKVDFVPEKPNVPEKLVVYFLHDAYGLDWKSIETLEEAKRLLKENPGLKANLTGYTDSIGEKQYNLYLSKLRADMVEDYLLAHGVKSSQIESKGAGSENPIQPNETLEGRAQNRRVEIRFEPTPK